MYFLQYAESGLVCFLLLVLGYSLEYISKSLVCISKIYEKLIVIFSPMFNAKFKHTALTKSSGCVKLQKLLGGLVSYGPLSHIWLGCHLSTLSPNIKAWIMPNAQRELLPFIDHSKSLATRICFFTSAQKPVLLHLLFLLVCVNFNAVIFHQNSYCVATILKPNSAWQRTVNTSVLKGYLSNWKPLLSTCYILLYICLLHTAGLWVLSALMWNCPNTRSLSMENTAGKGEESKEKRQERGIILNLKKKIKKSISELLRVFLNSIFF